MHRRAKINALRVGRVKPRLTAALSLTFVLLLAAGCVSTPQKPDENYPAPWPQEFASLGPKCEALDGTYANNGAMSSKEIPNSPVRFTNLILAYDPEARATLADADLLSIRGDVGLIFTTLHITSGDLHVEVPGCFCRDGTVLVSAIEKSSAGFPYLGLVASQTNAFLTKASDGSLIVMFGGNTSGLAVIVPFYYEHPTKWARFESKTPTQ